MIGSLLRAAFCRATIRKADQHVRAAVERLNMVADQPIAERKPLRLGELVDSLARDRRS